MLRLKEIDKVIKPTQFVTLRLFRSAQSYLSVSNYVLPKSMGSKHVFEPRRRSEPRFIARFILYFYRKKALKVYNQHNIHRRNNYYPPTNDNDQTELAEAFR